MTGPRRPGIDPGPTLKRAWRCTHGPPLTQAQAEAYRRKKAKEAKEAAEAEAKTKSDA